MIEYITVWVLFLLLPLVPAILLYKIFPKSITELVGRVLGYTIKAGGAVALYLVCVLLSNHYIAGRMLDSIENYVSEVKVKVNFRDQNGFPVNINLDQAQRENKFTVALVPDIDISSDRLTVYVPEKIKKRGVDINLMYRGFETRTINIDEINEAIKNERILEETLYVKKADFKQFEGPGNPENNLPQGAP